MIGNTRPHRLRDPLFTHVTSSWGALIGLSLMLSCLTFWDVPNLGFDSDDQDYLKHAADRAAHPSLLLSPAEAFPFGRPTTELVFVLSYTMWQDNAQHDHVALVLLHVLASLLLFQTLRKLGLTDGLCFLSSLFFLVNASHFQAVHWISCTAYVLTLVFGLVALIGFLNYIDTSQKKWLILSALAITMATGAHSVAIAFPLFCFYILWRMPSRSSKPLLGASLLLALSCALTLGLYITYADAPQNAAVLTTFAPRSVLTNLLGYLGRLIISTVWLPGFLPINHPHIADYAMGGFGCLIFLYAIFRGQRAIEAGALWMLLSLLPFITHSDAWNPTWPSRYFYLPSIAVSILMAWGLLSFSNAIRQRANTRFAQGFLITTTIFALLVSVLANKKSEAVTLYKESRHDIATGDNKTATDNLNKAIQKAPDLMPSDAYERLALSALNQGQILKEMTQTAAGKHPENWRLKMLLGVFSLLDMDPSQHPQGELLIAEAIENAPNRKLFLINLATVYLQSAVYLIQENRYREAISFLERTLEIRPDHPKARYLLGAIRATLGEYDLAIDALTQTIQLDPNYLDAYETLGDIYMLQGQKQQAIKIYQKAILKSPAHGSIQNKLMHIQSQESQQEQRP